MSRRKQANPRSIKALGEPPSTEDLEPIANPDCDISVPADEQIEQDDCPEPVPLVVDTTTPLPSLDDSPPALSLQDPPFGLKTQPSPLLPSPRSPILSTPSSPGSTTDSSANKRNRGKKIMPVAGEDGKARWQCPICQEELSSDHELTVHIRSHNTTQAKQPNTCTICGKVLSSQSSLDRHMLVHSGERPFKCKVCKMSFTTNGNMHRHSRIHAKDELKAAQGQGGSLGGKSKSSSSLSTSVVDSGHTSSPSTRSSRGSNSKTKTSSWHHPHPFNPNDLDHGHGMIKEPLPTSGIELQQYMLAMRGQHPFPNYTLDFTPKMEPIDIDSLNLPQLHSHLKRLPQTKLDNLSLPSPSKQPCVNNAEGSLEGGRMGSEDRPRESLSATPGTGEDSAVDLTISETKKSSVKSLHHQDNHHYNPFRRMLHLLHSPQQQHLEEAHCHLCNKNFISEFGLSLHMETHQKDHKNKTINRGEKANTASDAAVSPDSVTEESIHPCTKCKDVFFSRRMLIVHMILVHKSELATPANLSPLPPGKNGMSKPLGTSTPGFADLDFLDFTTNKFALAAKVCCEKNPRKPSSQFHSFSCKRCNCSFPSESSLEMHAAVHRPHNWTRCPLCDCYFVNTDLLHTHMHKHIADKAMVDSLLSETGENAGKPDSMGQGDFLAMFDLVPAEEVTNLQKNENTLESISKAQNNEYFAKVGQFLQARQGSSEKAASSPDNTDDSPSKEFPSMSAAADNLNSPSGIVFPSTALTPGVPSPVGEMMSPGAVPPSTFLNVPAVLQTVSHLNHVNAEFSPSSPISMLHANDQHMFTPPLGTSPSPLVSESADSVHDKKGVFACKYCGETFSNYRALKGHTRVHLGLSPYKCNLCSYSSADKSTLIRHLRTHNGERPFQCLICDYAFTTKANCERHVRKKHEKMEKEEIEKAITYNKYTTDLSAALDNFHSPDTVCKYCGRDFKFFRALKHHLRSHSSCRQKPFMCTKCQVGFSMKANCIRHIQKQHAEVSQLDIEQFIQVNELSQNAADIDDSEEVLQGSDDISCSPSSTPGLPGQGLAPPSAYSTPVLPPEVADKIAGVREFPEPLDFSLKNPVMAARLSGMFYPMMQASHGQDNHEQPIDLTVKRRSASPSPLSSVASPAPSPSLPLREFLQNASAANTPNISQTVSDLPCHLCKKTFGSKEDLLAHLHDVHQVPVNPTSMDAPFPISDSNNNTSAALMTQFLPMISSAQLSSLLQARVAAFTPHPAFSLQQKLAYLSPRPIHPSLLQTIANVKQESGTANTASTGSASDSSCDLASVNKILDATDAQKFQAFLKPTSAANSGSDDSEPQSGTWESADDDSDQSLDQLYAQSQQSAALRAASEKENKGEEEENEMMEDEEMDQEREMEDSQENSGDGESQSENGMDKMNSDDDVLVMEIGGIKTDMLNKLSPEGGKAGEGGTTPVKKKRNSYADSPHKLNCPYCPRSFPWVSSLNRHLLTHTGQKPFKCPRCPVTFSTKSNRERHLIRKHGVNMLDPASRQTMDRPYKCHLCVFSSFSTESNLLKHYKERHPGCSPPERYLEKMGDGDSLMDSSGRDLSMDKMDETSLSNMDGNAFNRTENSSMDSSEVATLLKPPVAASSPKLVNTVVAALLKREPKDSSHSFMPTVNDMDDNEEDSSDNQGQNDLGYSSLNSALFSGSAERHINPERDNYNVDKITNCWKCGEEFNSRKLLVRHLKEHNIDLPFKCYLCDASYDSRQECLAHQEKVHGSDWAILKEKNGVDSVEIYAERLDRIVERNCKTGQFLEEGDDADGMGIGGMEDGQGGDVVASDYLQRKVYCSLCPKRFWSLQDLRRHMRSHTGERPFECDKCQKRFTLKHSMMRHRRKHITGSNHDSPTILSDDEDSIQGDNPGKGPSSNTGTGHRALRQHLALTAALNKPIVSSVLKAAAAAESAANALPTTVTANKDNGDEDDGDMLHNLLGVDSATMDRILDAKDSAASLLGVKEKV